MPGAQLLAKALKAGRFGRIDFVQVLSRWNRGNEYYNRRWQGTWETDGGAATINQSIHTIDVATWLLGQTTDKPRDDAFSIERATIVQNGFRGDVMEAEDFARATLRFDGGPEVEIVATTAAAPEEPWTIEIMGEGNAVLRQSGGFRRWSPAVANDTDDALATKLLMSVDSAVDTAAASDPAAVGSANHARMMEHFAECIASGSPSDLETVNGGHWAGELIRRIYATASDPGRIRPHGFAP